MKKNIIAESIIIRVGGGIREVRREPADVEDTLDIAETSAELEQQEDLQSFQPGLGSASKVDKTKVVN